MEGRSGTPEVQSIAGSWTLTDSLLNYSFGRPIRCISGRAALTIEPRDVGFGGTLSDATLCLTVTDTSATGEMSGLGDRSGTVSGTTDGDTISFTAAFCTYEGRLSGDPPNRMQGKEECFLHLNATDSLFYGGDWEATR